MAAALSAAARATRLGALCYDHTFTRLLGTRGESEPILKDLVAAWRAARTGGAAQAAADDVDVEILDRQVLAGAQPRGKGDLVADVRLRGGKDTFIVEVQHRVEPSFPRRALLYASAEFVSRHMADPASQRPVHTIAFCDFDFARGRDGIRSGLSAWRKAEPPLTPATERAVHFYNLLPSAAAMASMGQLGNEALDEELASRLSFVFALLPHAPRLQDLTTATPPLLRWASLVAHVAPDNLDEVPAEVRSKGVDKLMSMLSGSVDVTKAERLEAEAKEDDFERAMESALAEGDAKGEARGRAEGWAEGRADAIAEMLARLSVASKSAFSAKFGVDPASAAAAFFDQSKRRA